MWSSPSLGKSTLLSRLSRARPESADYPFTTKFPNLGLVSVDIDRNFVLADIPGLIAGAAQGAGLGHDFLRHIERTRLLIHLIDSSAEDVVADLNVVEGELTAYGHGLDQRPRLVVLNKIELLDPASLEELVEKVSQQVQASGGLPVLAISAAASKNLPQLLAAVWQQLGIIQP